MSLISVHMADSATVYMCVCASDHANPNPVRMHSSCQSMYTLTPVLLASTGVYLPRSLRTCGVPLRTFPEVCSSCVTHRHWVSAPRLAACMRQTANPLRSTTSTRRIGSSCLVSASCPPLLRQGRSLSVSRCNILRFDRDQAGNYGLQGTSVPWAWTTPGSAFPINFIRSRLAIDAR